MVATTSKTRWRGGKGVRKEQKKAFGRTVLIHLFHNTYIFVHHQKIGVIR